MILGSYSDEAFTSLNIFREQVYKLVSNIETSGYNLNYAIGKIYNYYCINDPNTMILYLASMCTIEIQKFINEDNLTLEQKNLFTELNKIFFVEFLAFYKCYKELDFQSFISLFYFEEENRSELTKNLINIFLGYSYLDQNLQENEYGSIKILEGILLAFREVIYSYVLPGDFLDTLNIQVTLPETSSLLLLWKGKFSNEKLISYFNLELDKIFKEYYEQEEQIKNLLKIHNLDQINPIQYCHNVESLLDQTIKELDTENKRLKKLKALELRKQLNEHKEQFSAAVRVEQEEIHKQVIDNIATQSSVIKEQIEQNYRANLNAADEAYREESRLALRVLACGIGLEGVSLRNSVSMSFSLSSSEEAKFNFSRVHNGRTTSIDFSPRAFDYAQLQQARYTNAQYAEIITSLNAARWKSLPASQDQIERTQELVNQFGKLSQIDASLLIPMIPIDTKPIFFNKTHDNFNKEHSALLDIKSKVDSTLEWLRSNNFSGKFTDRKKYTFKDFFAASSIGQNYNKEQYATKEITSGSSKPILGEQTAVKFLHHLTSAITTDAYANKVSKDTFSSSISSNQTSDLSASFVDQLLIGSGRAFVSTGQGVKQLGLALAEKLGVIEDGETANYTAGINAEQELYNLTPVGQSLTAKSSEVLTEVAMSVAIPGSAGSTSAKLIAESAAAGAIIGGIQATEDGSLASRLENAAINAVEGAIGGYVFNKTAQGLHWAWKEGKTQYGLYTFDKKVEVPHVFSKAKGGQAPKYGHVYDTPENRRIITETFTDQNNFIFKDKHGNKFFAKLLPDGTEAWVRKYNDKVYSAGINDTPKYFHIDGSIKDKYTISNGPKP